MDLARTTGAAQLPCWCQQVAFDPDILKSIPASARGLACLCHACALGKKPQ
jgi:hypothetical protein